MVRVFRQSGGYLIDLKKLKTEASEAWFNNKRKALQKALQNLQLLNENILEKFRNFSKATGRQKLSMKITSLKKSSP